MTFYTPLGPQVCPLPAVRPDRGQGRDVPDRAAGRRALPLRVPGGRGRRVGGRHQGAHQEDGGGLRAVRRELLRVI